MGQSRHSLMTVAAAPKKMSDDYASETQSSLQGILITCTASRSSHQLYEADVAGPYSESTLQTTKQTETVKSNHSGKGVWLGWQNAYLTCTESWVPPPALHRLGMQFHYVGG